ncbi:MAG: hypothetical protein KAF91_22810 [Nostoc sp. TH1S01]|nr:hypothetical protein [Nostoc sp. TH1S01]
MTQPKMYSSPRLVDFGYEPGTLVLGGMWLNTKIFDLCVHGRELGVRFERKLHTALFNYELHQVQKSSLSFRGSCGVAMRSPAANCELI